jgi:FkbM family methyltransferase
VSGIKSILLRLLPRTAKNYLFREQKRFSWETLDAICNEPEVLILEELFAKHPHLHFFDIGANKGEYVFAAEKHLSPEQIYAFEPNPRLFKRLQTLFRGVNTFPFAISNRDQEATFRIPTVNGQEDDTLGSLDTNGKLENETSVEMLTVNCRTLDSFVKEKTPGKIDCIKADVEGFEMTVVEGARHTISTYFPLLLIEIEKRHHPGKTVLELIDRIKRFAPEGKTYEVFYFDILQHRILPVVTEPSQEKKDWGTRRYVNNFLFVPALSVYMQDINSINNKLNQLFGIRHSS